MFLIVYFHLEAWLPNGMLIPLNACRGEWIPPQTAPPGNLPVLPPHHPQQRGDHQAAGYANRQRSQTQGVCGANVVPLRHSQEQAGN